MTTETSSLHRLELAEAAREVLGRYCLALDSVDLAMLEALFTGDVVLQRSPATELRGRPAVVGFFADAFAHRVERRKHFATNPLVTVRGRDEAEIQCYFLALHHDRGELSLTWGNYLLGLRREGDAMRIAAVSISLDVPMAPLRGMIGRP